MSQNGGPKSLFDKIWDAHEVDDDLIYVDLHLVHEVTSAQAFDGLRLAVASVRRPDKTLATADHNVPTDGTAAAKLIADELSRKQVEALESQLRGVRDPDLLAGLRAPGDRARDRPRAGRHPAGDDDRLRRLPHLHPRRLRGARVRDRHLRGRARAGDPVPGPEAPARRCGSTTAASLADGVTAKDLILATIGRLGVGGMQGHAVEYAGPAIEALTIENRLTVCNMTIEGGGRAGMIAPDETTFEYMRGRPGIPGDFDAAVAAWSKLPTEEGASFDREVEIDAPDLSPMVTWGTNPGMVVEVTSKVPDPAAIDSPVDREPPSAPSPTWT